MIVLLGPKHSGKTSAGKILARKLGLPFRDLDALAAGGKTPRELWREGAAVFRAAEAAALEGFLRKNEDAVLAAGGGIIDNRAALSLLEGSDAAVAVLEVGAETAWKRIAAEAEKSGSLPPFLEKEGEAPEEVHRLLHERRTAAYRAFAERRRARGLAAFAVNAEGKTPEEAAAAICCQYAVCR